MALGPNRFIGKEWREEREGYSNFVRVFLAKLFLGDRSSGMEEEVGDFFIQLGKGHRLSTLK